MKNNKKIRVIELFAGVGGFRLGLEGWNGKSASSNYTKPLRSNFEVIWSNQWEPATKTQHASLVYESRFSQIDEARRKRPDTKESEYVHSNDDIEEVSEDVDINIPEHDLLVGGFPCQDYSVATTLKNSKGLIGKKGVLWWSIHKILSVIKNKPRYLLLENVDRLLKSPAKQRGRDFAIMLKSLEELGYVVEWRIINAAEYGMPQRRRRIFIMGYHETSPICRDKLRIHDNQARRNLFDWITKRGVLAKAFPIKAPDDKQVQSCLFDEIELQGNIVDISEKFNSGKSRAPFENTGIMWRGRVLTYKSIPDPQEEQTTLRDVLIDDEAVDDTFYISKLDLEQWEYLKGAKKEKRKSASGHEYYFSEGGMVFPDDLDKPSRTIITGEGGRSASRFKHVVKPGRKRHRRLTPVELERLNMFPDNHTEHACASDTKRAFFMGNALVVGVVEKIGQSLQSIIKDTSD